MGCWVSVSWWRVFLKPGGVIKTVALAKLGRHGNQLFRAAHAFALCEQNGYELRMQESPLEQIFTLDGWQPKRPTGSEDIVIDGYHQDQASLIYSRADCRRWFKIRPEVEKSLKAKWWKAGDFVTDMPHAHLRRGDYAGAGYPIISVKAVASEIQRLTGDIWYIGVSDENPTLDPEFTGELSFLPDFYRLMRAPVLFRANSSFSYWASVLGNSTTYSPVITGLEGGVEHDNVPYVIGNHPCLCELDFVTDLHLPE